MNFAISTLIKSDEQPFPQVHFMLGGKYHIVEINDCNQDVPRFSFDHLSRSIFGKKQLERFTFCSSDEGYYPIGDSDSLLATFGVPHVGNYSPFPYSRFSLEVRGHRNKKYVKISSTFNNKKVVSKLCLADFPDEEQKELLCRNLEAIIRKLYKRRSSWMFECLNSMFDDDYS